MSAGAATGESKDTSHSSSNTNQNAVGTQTPNNLPYLQKGWQQAGALLGATNSATPNLAANGETLTSAATPLAINTAVSGATAASGFANGDNVNNPANQYLTPTASGDFLSSSNPSFQAVVDQTARALQPSIDGQFAAAGRYGSGANANAFDTALTNATADMAFGNYTNERANQLAAAGQLSQNNATGNQQRLEGASLTPTTTSNLFAPATANTAAAYAPLLAYFQALALGGTGGGTQTSNVGSNTTTNTKDIGLAHQDNAKFDFGSMMGGA